jgi:hypothetical protein
MFGTQKNSSCDDLADWKVGEKTPFAALSKTFEAIEDTTKRLIILDILTKYFVSVIQRSPDDLLPSIYLCINKVPYTVVPRVSSPSSWGLRGKAQSWALVRRC